MIINYNPDYDDPSVIETRGPKDIVGQRDSFRGILFRRDPEDSNPDGEHYAFGRNLYQGHVDKVDDSNPRGARIADDREAG